MDGMMAGHILAAYELLRLCGVLCERKPPFRHFDEKGFMRRSAGCFRQSNAFRRVLA
jgi:hypothetical protein